MFKSEVFLIGLTILFKAANSKTISTTNGDITGGTLDADGCCVDFYLGIPYSQPPLGELRFKPPAPAKPWNGTYDATHTRPSCMQPFCSVNCSEDCLYPNIWVPCNASNATSVMVWYHGGGFTTGSINDDVSNGSMMACLGEVIVVSAAYRLGSFGFFCSETEDARGNMGMKDQVLALQWVRNNIQQFAGNPANITIFGESAGGFSVSLHLVSPMTKGMFSSAIMQSGCAYISYEVFFRNSTLCKWRSTELATLIGCSKPNEDISTNPDVMICMRSKAASDIILVDTVVMAKLLLGPGSPWLTLFTPIYGDDYLPCHPIRYMDAGKVNAKTIMVGNTKDEGAGFMAGFAAPYLVLFDQPRIIKPLAEIYIGIMFRGLDTVHPQEVSRYYLWNASFFDPSLLKRSYHSIGDEVFHCPCVFLAERCSDKGVTLYYYYFVHRWSQSPEPLWFGVAHAMELRFLFGLPFIKRSSYLPSERKLSREMIYYWTSFAKQGRPVSANSSVWPPYGNGKRVAINLDTSYNVSFSDPYKEACYFWNKTNERADLGSCSDD